MRVLVTGGLGLQGSRIAKRMLQEDHEVVIVDDASRGRLENLPTGAKFERINLAEHSSELVRVFQDVDLVFHMAAQLYGVEGHIGKDYRQMTTNLRIDLNVIEACVKKDVEGLVYPSTACVYPLSLQAAPDAPPLKEEQAFPAEAENAYGWAKLIGEMACREAYEENGLRVGIARLFNVYGTGEDWSPGSHVVPELIRKSLVDAPFLQVYGDGEQTRALTYVDDAVEGLIRLMERRRIPDPINIGNPDRVSVRRLAEIILEITGSTKRIVFDTSKPVGAVGRCPDISKARKLLGWEPKTSLRDGLVKTIMWYKNHEFASNDRLNR